MSKHHLTMNPLTNRQVWQTPVLLATSTIVGLCCALLSEQAVWQYAAWLLIGCPPLMVVYHWWRSRRCLQILSRHNHPHPN